MRKIQHVYQTTPTLEGAGVRLKRGFSHKEVQAFDPFLLFDDFSNAEATAYRAGFPLHPHRGIETVTYMLKGEVHHKDSLGNEGSIKAGEVQWMTSGSGILHEEMPVVHEEGLEGFQLWVNLPSTYKMMAPRYQEIQAVQIPCIEREGVTVRVIAGVYEDVRGPVQDLMVAPTYFDITVGAGATCTFPTSLEETFFVYVFEGRIVLRENQHESWLRTGEIGLLSNDTQFACAGGTEGARFLLIGGKPLREPVAWYGPIVMNTDAELRSAIDELNNGTFIQG